MPLQFASKPDYTTKLTELLLIEAECERVLTESIASARVSFVFEERLDIFAKLTVMIPKAL